MNSFLTPTWFTTDVAMFWDNELRLARSFDRSYNDEFRNKPEGVQIGSTVNARIPQRFTVTEGEALVEQGILNQSVPITINHFQHVGTGWSTVQSALEVEEVQERYSKPTGRALANKVDVVCGAEIEPVISSALVWRSKRSVIFAFSLAPRNATLSLKFVVSTTNVSPSQ